LFVHFDIIFVLLPPVYPDQSEVSKTGSTNMSCNFMCAYMHNFTHTVHMLCGKLGDTFVHVLRYVPQNYMSFIQICWALLS